ncbi:hypothetical protein BDZ91DRAFT_98335 [Kalaharituber pfeilii]|nr:hypothetical protein BDZ91DRAFT_98335 [Kalaharituber pfeilii]
MATSAGSLSSVDTDASTLNEARWPGKLDTAAPILPCDLQIASESLRSTIQALGSEKMAQIRSVITAFQKQRQQQQNNTTTPSQESPEDLTKETSDSTETLTSASEISVDIERPTDEVALTICLLESALGAEDMSELRSAMIAVRKQSIHLDRLISSTMTSEELERSVEAVRARQEEVLEMLFVEIMALIGEKLGVETGVEPQIGCYKMGKDIERAFAPKKEIDESKLLKVPEVDPSGRRPTTPTTKGKRPKSKRPFDGYSMYFYGAQTRRLDERAGIPPRRNYGTTKSRTSSLKTNKNEASNDKTKHKTKSKAKRPGGCIGFCSIM